MNTTKAVLSSAFKNFELTGWERSAAVYHDTFTRLTSQNIQTTLKAANIKKGSKLVDLCCGPGLLTAAAQEIGAEATGIDFSEKMVTLAQQHFPNASFSVDDVEKLQIEDDTFDAAIMNFGMLHLANPTAAMAEAKRILKNGGSFVFTVWETPDHAKGFQIALNAINALGATDVDLPAGPPFFLFSDKDHTLNALSDAGFTDVTHTIEPMTWQLPDGETFFKAFYDGTARTGGLLQSQSETAINDIKAKIISDVEAQFGGEQGVEIPMPCIIYSAKT